MAFPSANLFAATGDKGAAKEIEGDYKLPIVEVVNKENLTKEEQEKVVENINAKLAEILTAYNEGKEEKVEVKGEINISKDLITVPLSDGSILTFNFDEVMKEAEKPEEKPEDKPDDKEPEISKEEQKAIEDAKNFEFFVSVLPTREKVTLQNKDMVDEASALYKGLSELAKSKVSKETMDKFNGLVDAIKALEKKTEDEKSAVEKAMDDFKKGVKVVTAPHNGLIDIELPTPNVPFEARVSITGEKGIMRKEFVVSKLTQVSVPWEGEGKQIKVDINLYKDGKRVINGTKSLVTPKAGAPVLNYAYVFDGGLILNIDAPAGVDKIYWAYKGEREPRLLSSDGGYGTYFSYTNEKKDTWAGVDFGQIFGQAKGLELDRYTRVNKNDYRIDVDVPSTVNILVVDKNKNQSPFQIKVDKDNVPLTNTVPANVQKALKDATHFNFSDNDKYKDLIVVDKNSVVDLFSEFKDYIIKTFKQFNTRNLRWTVEEVGKEGTTDIPYTGVHKFAESGSFLVTVTDTESKSTLTLSVIVNDGTNNVRDYKLKDKEVKVEKDTFKAIDALDLTLYHGDEKANPIQFVAIVNGEYRKLTDELSFKDKDGKDVNELKIEIVNLKDNKSYDVVFKKGEAEKKAEAKDNTVNANALSDISGHWAESLIRQMAGRGVITGYDDGTFKPDNRITIKETLAIMGRFAKQNESRVNIKSGDYNIEPDKDKWGYEEVNYAMDRMPENIFAGKNITTEAITREETAYVIAHLFNSIVGNSAKEITDITTSTYPTEVIKLVNAGVIKGFPDGTFKPHMDITRAELTSLLFYVPGM